MTIIVIIIRIGTRTGGLGNLRMGGNCQNYSIVEIGQNTEESHGDLKRTCCHSNSSEKTSANNGVKIPKMRK